MTGTIPTPTSTAQGFEAVTPSDSVELPSSTKGLWVNVLGDVVAEDWNGNEVTFTVPAGVVLPIRPRYVKVGTTATVFRLFS